MQRTFFGAGIVAVALMTAGCGGDGDTSTADTRVIEQTPVGTAGDAAADAQDPMPAELPDTASPLALIGGLGALALAAAAGMRLRRWY